MILNIKNAKVYFPGFFYDKPVDCLCVYVWTGSPNKKLHTKKLLYHRCVSYGRWPHSFAHQGDVIMNTVVASQITSLTIVYSTVYSGADQRKGQSSASLAFVRGIHRSQMNSPHKGPVTRKMFQSDDVIMKDCDPLPITLPAFLTVIFYVSFNCNKQMHSLFQCPENLYNQEAYNSQISPDL